MNSVKKMLTFNPDQDKTQPETTSPSYPDGTL